ncbi:vacuolar protein sorting-associated protein 33A [Tribolium madens]|uniref:vacuolar protein sorting-associated protein 33A n=1 Tax=Tribolium madens TaxID=41895 RepID=UPI001CF72FCC|nr:vacuolar protein sorting-associated protein 33A [Tribolium madens]XP_044261510.1 vacuolar protein sorting-associated protein 33A [Tribolium madens]
MSSHLQGGRVDISLIQTAARNNLITLLEKCPGPKAIVWDNSLAGPVGLIAQYAVLKEHSVTKMFPLRPTPLPETDVAHVIFITRPKLHLMDFVGYNVHADSKTKTGSKKQYHVFFVPKKSLLCLERLKHNGVYGSVSLVEEFRCELFPFDSDVVSMEISEVFREYTLENDPTYLYQTAQAIIFLQKLYGPIPRVWGKGPAARQVWELVTRLQREKNAPLKTNQTSTIDQILLIDRGVDLITPLATQLTYEGLIDEIFGINNSTAQFPIDNFLSSEERTSESLSEDKKQIILNSADRLFSDIRDRNFNAVGAFLSKQAKAISAQLDNSQERSVQEMKLYVQKLPQILAKKKALAHHTAIAECIKEVTDSYEFLDTLQTEQEFLNCIEVDKASPYIEDLIAHGKPLVKVLRLICLQCITSSGLKPKVLEHYKRELVQVYGLQALLAITNLEKVGLLKVQSGTRQYTVLRKALRLTMEDTSEINPTDISYVHSVYAPLSVRLAEQVTKNGGWKQLQDVLGLLPGPTLDETPPVPNLAPNNSDTPSVVLVFFIGGCTFAEISALRFLSQQEDSNVEFVVATTKLINGTSFLKSIIDV